MILSSENELNTHAKQIHEYNLKHLESIPTQWARVENAIKDFYGLEIDKFTFDIKLAFVEAANNVIQHAHKLVPTDFQIKMYLKTDEIEFWVFDYGKGFDLKSKIKCVSTLHENSRGVYLINSAVDSLDYVKGKKCNILIFKKKINLKNNSDTKFLDKNKRKFLLVNLQQEEQDFFDEFAQENNYNVQNINCSIDLEQVLYSNLSLDLLFVYIEDEDLSNFEMIQQFKKNTKNKFIPIIALTKNKKIDVMIQSFLSGCNQFITLPCNKMELKSKVSSLLELKDKTRYLEISAQQMTTQLDEAKALQVGILPSKNELIHGCDFDYIFKPSSYVGGDMLNYFSVNENISAFYVADVSGHGVASAMFSIWLNKILTPSISKSGIIKQRINKKPFYQVRQPSEVCHQLDKLMDDSQEQYLTMFFGYIDHQKNTLTYSCCGHPQPYVLRGKKHIKLKCENPPIGMGLGLDFKNHSMKLKDQDKIFVYSDCVVETKSPEGVLFDSHNLEIFLDRSEKVGTEQLNSLVSVLKAYSGEESFEDDLTILKIHFNKKKEKSWK